MSQPPAYAPSFDFGDFSTLYPTTPQPGTSLDTEFANIATTIAAIRANLALLQRDDTQLANAIVTPDSLSAVTKALIATSGWLPRGSWITATAYAAKDVVDKDGITYVCITAHTSGTFSTDLAAGKWQQFLPTVTAYAQTLLAAINAAAARIVLGLVIGADVQAYDADLAAIAALSSAANKMPYATGAQTWALADLTAAGRAILDDADAAAQRTTLGVKDFNGVIVGSGTGNTGLIADNAEATFTVPVTGVVMGSHYVLAAMAGTDAAGCKVWGVVTANDTVTVHVENNTGSNKTPASQTFYVLCLAKSVVGQ